MLTKIGKSTLKSKLYNPYAILWVILSYFYLVTTAVPKKISRNNEIKASETSIENESEMSLSLCW